jgi:hypothetical protein
MSTIEHVSEESILFLYDTFGVNFWLRVVENMNGDKQPLQLDVRFHGSINEETKDFVLNKGEDVRGKQLFGLLPSLLDRDHYKHTPFMSHDNSGARFTFDPGLIRFIFRPETLPVLMLVGARGRYLALVREARNMISEPLITKEITQVLDFKQIDLGQRFATVRELLHERGKGNIDDAELTLRLSEELGTGEGTTGILSAKNALEKAIEDDPVFGVQRDIGINRFRELVSLLQQVVTHNDQQDTSDAKAAEEAEKLNEEEDRLKAQEAEEELKKQKLREELLARQKNDQF